MLLLWTVVSSLCAWHVLLKSGQLMEGMITCSQGARTVCAGELTASTISYLVSFPDRRGGTSGSFPKELSLVVWGTSGSLTAPNHLSLPDCSRHPLKQSLPPNANRMQDESITPSQSNTSACWDFWNRKRRSRYLSLFLLGPQISLPTVLLEWCSTFFFISYLEFSLLLVYCKFQDVLARLGSQYAK